MKTGDFTLYAMIMFICLALALDSVFDWGIAAKFTKPLTLEVMKESK